MSEHSFRTRALSPEDVASGFRSGTRQLDDYFHRHALANGRGDVGRTHVLEASAAEAFYGKYDFVTVDSTSWPRRMFLPIEVARTALAD
jgi:hypothetical protein